MIHVYHSNTWLVYSAGIGADSMRACVRAELESWPVRSPALRPAPPPSCDEVHPVAGGAWGCAPRRIRGTSSWRTRLAPCLQYTSFGQYTLTRRNSYSLCWRKKFCPWAVCVCSAASQRTGVVRAANDGDAVRVAEGPAGPRDRNQAAPDRARAARRLVRCYLSPTVSHP